MANYCSSNPNSVPLSRASSKASRSVERKLKDLVPNYEAIKGGLGTILSIDPYTTSSRDD